jgi:CRISPR-associated protein Csb1
MGYLSCGTDADRARFFRSQSRAKRWCEKRTERDARLAKTAGRPLTEQNQRRWIERRRWELSAEAEFEFTNLKRTQMPTDRQTTDRQITDQTTLVELTFEALQKAVAGNAAAIRCRTKLQPAAGAGTKVFPPTHAGGVYATETRRLPVDGKPGETREVPCVLLDSVQSQANRMEDALQDAIDTGELKMPLLVVEFGDQVADVQRVTSLQAPHRAADAILRDSLIDNVAFRKSEIGKAITDSSLVNATALYRHCPHALFLGVWDSTGPKGGLGAKFARALVSEIVGVDAVIGVRTSSRLDPLQARAAAKVVKSDDGTWKMAKDDKAKTAVSPAEINHGNIPPDVAEGSATIAYAEHTAVLSLPQLRRLRFPIDGKFDSNIDHAARTVLAALALIGLTRSIERGCDLRSRCLLFPEDALAFELLETPGKPTPISLTSGQAIAIYDQAVQAATKLGLPWETEPVKLKPSPELIALVRKSQELAATGGEESAED